MVSDARQTREAGSPSDVLVVFGITGDLAKVMTFQALYRLEQRGLLGCPIVGVAFDDWSLEQLIDRARESIVATGEPTRRADALAERLRAGLNGVLERHGIRGLVYGESSVFHIFLEAAGGRLPVARPDDYRWLDAVTLKSMDPTLIRALQNGFRVRGIELLSYNGGMTSAASSMRRRSESGVCSEGLRIWTLPAASAGENFQTAIMSG